MSGKRVLFEQNGPLALITFDNPPKRNALSLAMWREFAEVLERIQKLPDLRCAILLGAGNESFISGADISEFGERRSSPNDVAAYDRAGETALDRLQALPLVTIAMIRGFCIGAGVAVALSCDIRVSDSEAIFSIPAARLGLGYGYAATAKFVDIVGSAWATDMLFSGRRCSADEALRMRLVTQTFERADLAVKVKAYAHMIAQNAPLAIRASKTIIAEIRRSPDLPDIGRCERVVADCVASEDYAEGALAFAEKRQPCFSGR